MLLLAAGASNCSAINLVKIVATFLAALELGRLKKMKVYQEEVYAAIYLELIETLKGFDTHLASGFDAVNATAPQEPSPPSVAS